MSALAFLATGGDKLSGTVTSVGSKFGFIESAEAKATYTSDVFVHIKDLHGAKVGDEVVFELVVNEKGQPQARNLQTAASFLAGEVVVGSTAPTNAPTQGGPTRTGEKLTGTIARIGAKFGFIACDVAKERYGKDVFAPLAALAGASVGQEVEFELLLNDKGEPQAGNCRPTAGHVGHAGHALIVPWGSQAPPRATPSLVRPAPYAAAPAVAAAFAQPAFARTQPSKGIPTGLAFTGVVDRIGPKFGFIKCQPVKDQYGDDVFCPAALLQSFSVGAQVDFDLQLNDKGQPQASNMRAHDDGSGGGFGGGAFGGGGGCGGKQFNNAAVPTGQTFFGVIHASGPKFGFISCPPVKAQFGVDVFCHSSGLQGYSVGDQVEFDLEVSPKGQPQAANLRPHGSKSPAWGNGCGTPGNSMAMAVAAGGKDQGAPGGKEGPAFSGVVATVGPKFGFIDAPDVKAQFGTDVFCVASVLQGCGVGDPVEFQLAFSDKGQPQAVSLWPAGGAPPLQQPGKGGGGPGLHGLKGGSYTGEVHTGTLSWKGPKFGFIDCPEVKASYQKDVWVPPVALQGFEIGQTVQFELVLSDKGEPQAGLLTPAGQDERPQKRPRIV